jgi:hypothetical protein
MLNFAMPYGLTEPLGQSLPIWQTLHTSCPSVSSLEQDNGTNSHFTHSYPAGHFLRGSAAFRWHRPSVSLHVSGRSALHVRGSDQSLGSDLDEADAEPSVAFVPARGKGPTPTVTFAHAFAHPWKSFASKHRDMQWPHAGLLAMIAFASSALSAAVAAAVNSANEHAA